MPTHLEKLHFDNSYARLGEEFSVRLEADAFENPHLVSFSASCAEALGLNLDSCTPENLCKYFSGQQELDGSELISTVYAGHQFGGYTARLGDGRAILLGEIINDKNERWDLQLKGAGSTPFSRMGDGRAVLRSVIREYLGGEAMYHLGIGTTRALCIIGSDLDVQREQVEKGATMLRAGQSHIRFGHFEYFFNSKRFDQVKILLDYTLKRNFPELVDEEDCYAKFYQEVCERTGKMIAQWQSVGFTHGVMNTDNMCITGDTIDYGPYGFMDDYQAAYTPNHSDHQGRYSYDNQMPIAHWNLRALAYSLQDYVNQDAAEAGLKSYEKSFHAHYQSIMAQKLGLTEAQPEFVEATLNLLEKHQVDFTLFFRHLAEFPTKAQAVEDLFSCSNDLHEWAMHYEKFIDEYSLNERATKMNQVNPLYIPRNYLLQEAIEKAEAGDFEMVNTLLKLWETPFDEKEGMQRFAEAAPDWGKKLVISCSS